ncbi:MAG: hypothetical protein K2X87_09600 [Gemmataceae bacterium]|nr:hypothetical protein [Gemmataceae bacterium]
MTPSGPSFVPLGRTVATPAALAAVSPPDIAAALRRHASGDWGEVDADDRAANHDALKFGSASCRPTARKPVSPSG